VNYKRYHQNLFIYKLSRHCETRFCYCGEAISNIIIRLLRVKVHHPRNDENLMQ
jgi:hypothetical protein